MKTIKRANTGSIAFHKPEMVVDYLCSVFPHINPYLALIGRVAATELLEPESLNNVKWGYIREYLFKQISSKAAYDFVSQVIWESLEERHSLEALSLAYLKLRHSPKHRLDKTYEHYICCQIGRAIISNKSFRASIQSKSSQLKQEIIDFERLLMDNFQCNLNQVSAVAINGFSAGSIKIQENNSPRFACSLCNSKLRLSVNSNTTIAATQIANFIGRLSSIEEIQRTGKSATMVDNKVYELIVDDESIEQINICSYSHIYQLIEASSNVLVGNPYFGPNLEFAVGYLPNEKGILD